jgi:hypothetical protein
MRGIQQCRRPARSNRALTDFIHGFDRVLLPVTTSELAEFEKRLANAEPQQQTERK